MENIEKYKKRDNFWKLRIKKICKNMKNIELYEKNMIFFVFLGQNALKNISRILKIIFRVEIINFQKF